MNRLGAETITAVAGGVWFNRGNVYDNTASGLTAINVQEALDELKTLIPSIHVDSVFGRTGVVVAVAGDYAASQVTNDSSVTGVNVDNALDTLDSDAGHREQTSDHG